MASNGYPEFNIDDALDNFGSFDYNLGFDGFGPDLLNTASPSQPSTATGIWEGLGHLLGPSDVAGPSRLYTGLEVQDELNSYPDFDLALFNPMPSMHLGSPVPPPAPTLSLGVPHLPAEPFIAPAAPTPNPSAQPQVVPNLDDLPFDLPTGEGRSSLPMVQPPPDHNLPWQEALLQFLQPGSHPDPPSLDSTAGSGSTPPLVASTHAISQGVAQPEEPPLPAPVEPATGPKRTKKVAAKARKHDPVKPSKKPTPKADKEGWDETLGRFQEAFNAKRGQSSGGLEPEVALTEVDKTVLEDLKRSPLQNGAPGGRRPVRDVEDYLKCLLSVLLPKPATGDGKSKENHDVITILSKLADELEAKLEVVNHRTALRESDGFGKERGRRKASKTPLAEMTEEERKKQEDLERTRARKRKNEGERRDRERRQMVRIARFFKAPPDLDWTRKDVLSFGILFLIYGPEVFTDGFVKPRPHLEQTVDTP